MTLSAVTGVKPTKLDDGDGEKLGGGATSVYFRTSAIFFPKNNMTSLAQKSVLSDVRVWPSWVLIDVQSLRGPFLCSVILLVQNFAFFSQRVLCNFFSDASQMTRSSFWSELRYRHSRRRVSRCCWRQSSSYQTSDLRLRRVTCESGARRSRMLMIVRFFLRLCPLFHVCLSCYESRVTKKRFQ